MQQPSTSSKIIPQHVKEYIIKNFKSLTLDEFIVSVSLDTATDFYNHHKKINTEQKATDQVKEIIQNIRNNSDHYDIYLFTFDNYLNYYVRFYYIISTQNDIPEWLITRHHAIGTRYKHDYSEPAGDDNDIFIKNLKSNIVLGFDKLGIKNITNGQIKYPLESKRKFNEKNMVTIQEAKTILNAPTKSKYLHYQKLLLNKRFKYIDPSLDHRPDRKYEKDYFPDKSCNLV
jgi:hypothetical protein